MMVRIQRTFRVQVLAATVGAVVGLLVLLPWFVELVSASPRWRFLRMIDVWINSNEFVGALYMLLSLPAMWALEAVDAVLFLGCAVFRSDRCAGLAFDGGPLVWVEYLTVMIAPPIAYTLVGWWIGRRYVRRHRTV